MTPEEQRIKIAEACGWEFAPGYPQQLAQNKSAGIPWQYINGQHCSDGRTLKGVPDYLNDLNAIREAERKIIDRAKWYEEIQRVLWPHRKPKKPFGLLTGDIFDIANTTAAQRAEAFLKTLNLWIE